MMRIANNRRVALQFAALSSDKNCAASAKISHQFKSISIPKRRNTVSHINLSSNENPRQQSQREQQNPYPRRRTNSASPSILRKRKCAYERRLSIQDDTAFEYSFTTHNAEERFICSSEIATTPILSDISIEKDIGCKRNRNKKVSFQERIVSNVQEFVPHYDVKEDIWYTRKELLAFHCQARASIIQYENTKKSISHSPKSKCSHHSKDNKISLSSMLFNHPALQPDCIIKEMKQSVLKKEMRNILIVDSHDLECKLIARSLEQLMSCGPYKNDHVNIHIATSSANAVQLYNKYHFDIVLIEDRMHLFHHQQKHHFGYNSRCRKNQNQITKSTTTTDPKFLSGSELMEMFASNNTTTGTTPSKLQPLLIGLSRNNRNTFYFNTDEKEFQNCGADYCWSKQHLLSSHSPTCDNNQSSLDELLYTLLMKRGKRHIIDEIF